jgi:hypothetical protein
MTYANKKINQSGNLAQQTAQIIANVAGLEAKKLISLSEDTVFLYPQLWKDKTIALNWIKCLHHYYVVKRKLKPANPLYFKHIETNELLGTMHLKKAKVLILLD